MGLQHSFKRGFTGTVTSLSTTLAKAQQGLTFPLNMENAVLYTKKMTFLLSPFFSQWEARKKKQTTPPTKTKAVINSCPSSHRSQIRIINGSLFTLFLQVSAAHLNPINLCPQGQKGTKKLTFHSSLQTDPDP